MSYTLLTSGSAIAKAGANASSTAITSATLLLDWANHAEGRIVTETRRDWVTDYSQLSTDLKYALQDAASSLVAKQIICYDMSGYTNLGEATQMLNVQNDTAREALIILKDFKSNTIKTV